MNQSHGPLSPSEVMRVQLQKKKISRPSSHGRIALLRCSLLLLAVFLLPLTSPSTGPGDRTHPADLLAASRVSSDPLPATSTHCIRYARPPLFPSLRAKLSTRTLTIYLAISIRI
jgi:hypothetical protein